MALHNLSEDKALRPDGFPLKFFKAFWSVLGVDVMLALDELLQDANLYRSLIASFVLLIPKKRGAAEIAEFRPIRLLGSFYRILAKVLAWQLNEVLDVVISPYQHAFIKGCQILDCSLIANECLDSWTEVGFNGLMCKVDMEKTYGHVNWNFLNRVMAGNSGSGFVFAFHLSLIPS